MPSNTAKLWTLALVAAAALGCKKPPPTSAGAIAKEPNHLYWGNTHVHTSDSSEVQNRTPLDFVIVAGHFDTPTLARKSWLSVVQAAQRHNEPCSFTSFIGWEWASSIEGRNLHRVVFMSGGEEAARRFAPFSALDSPRPEALWDWLAETSARADTDFIAIPHRPSVSVGRMFDRVDSDGRPITVEYARRRMRWEPVVDESSGTGDAQRVARDDVHAALLRGLQIEQRIGANPYKFGLIGSTGAYPGLTAAEPADSPEKAASDLTPSNMPDDSGSPIMEAKMNTRGLAGVWAEENTRGSIFRAFKRKEVYATSGPRIRVRFFGGWGFHAKHARALDMVTVGYTLGHPMGSDLIGAPNGAAPGFLMYAVKDPEGANLDRIQIVKGWVDAAGGAHERVYDVVGSEGRDPGEDGTLPPVEPAVDGSGGLDFAGAPALHGFWSDPDFDPRERAFYYLRVLQVPTPRTPLEGTAAIDTDSADNERATAFQERAYSSPIWYAP